MSFIDDNKAYEAWLAEQCDVVGFDASAPEVMGGFSRGDF